MGGGGRRGRREGLSYSQINNGSCLRGFKRRIIWIVALLERGREIEREDIVTYVKETERETDREADREGD